MGVAMAMAIAVATGVVAIDGKVYGVKVTLGREGSYARTCAALDNGLFISGRDSYLGPRLLEAGCLCACEQACANVKPKCKGAGVLGGDADAHLDYNAGLGYNGRGGWVDVLALVEADSKLGRCRDLSRHVTKSLDAGVEARLVQVLVVAGALEVRVAVTDLLGRVLAVAVVRKDLADLLVGELEACFYLARQGKQGVDAEP